MMPKEFGYQTNIQGSPKNPDENQNEQGGPFSFNFKSEHAVVAVAFWILDFCSKMPTLLRLLRFKSPLHSSFSFLSLIRNFFWDTL